MRSGADMPASAATLLADVIEGKTAYQSELVPVSKNIRCAKNDSEAIEAGLDIERMMRNKLSVNKAISFVAEKNGLDERTIRRRWSKYKKYFQWVI